MKISQFQKYCVHSITEMEPYSIIFERVGKEMNGKLIRQMIPIFASSFVAWFYCMIYTPLGLIYNTYPGQDALVMTIATLPGIIAMIGGFAAAALLIKMGSKSVVVLSLVLMIVGGMICRFLGTSGIHFAIIGSALTGFAAGGIPAANYSALASIVPASFKDKVFGWSDALCQAGLIAVGFLAGIFAAKGDWTHSFNVYYIAIVVLVIVLIAYPKNCNAEEAAAEAETGVKEKARIPGSVIGLIVIKFMTALFYMGLSLFISDLVINELQIGSAAVVGTITSLASVVATISAVIVFIWLKVFKKTSTMVAGVFLGVMMLIVSLSRSLPVIFACSLIMQIGMNTQHSSYGTVLANATKGKAVGVAAGIFSGATFIGEALGGYLNPWLANTIFKSTAASVCMRTSAIGMIIVAIISFFVFSKVYKLAFPDGKVKEQ